jgi:hypothetical protein
MRSRRASHGSAPPLNCGVRLQMKVRRKAFDVLGAADFERCPIWLVDLPMLDFATPVEPFDDLTADEPYVALSSYTLRDGTKFSGYCFIYDCSGHVLFGSNGQPIRLSTYAHCSPEEALSAAKALDRDVEEVFPIRYRASVKVHGIVPEGVLAVQSNKQLQRTGHA